MTGSELVFFRDGQIILQAHIKKSETSIGSDLANDVVVPDDSVPSTAAVLIDRGARRFRLRFITQGGLLINGTVSLQAEQDFTEADRIRLGPYELRIKHSEELESKPDRAGDRTGPIYSDLKNRHATLYHGMLACSQEMHLCFDLIKRIASNSEPVLIMGESGCGKELVARALHQASSRASGPFLALNCSGFASTLIEGELFGHVKGAFTGATNDKLGAFEATSGGTLFLDEVGELPRELQPKLLRVLESSTIRRVGDTRERPIDTRIVAATHRDLEALVESGEFRGDLFHRLFVLPIQLPALRNRPSDILPLARHFLATQAPERSLRLSSDAEQALSKYHWPGNIRELRNVIVRAILTTDEVLIRASHLRFLREPFATPTAPIQSPLRPWEEQQRQSMLDALSESGGNQAHAARILGISKSTFHDRLKRFGISSRSR